MIDLYYWTTPNGHKIAIFLEETGIPYSIKPVNIAKGEQFAPEFLAISPNNRIPAIVDHQPADGNPWGQTQQSRQSFLNQLPSLIEGLRGRSGGQA